MWPTEIWQIFYIFISFGMYIKRHRARLVLQVHGMTERGDPGIVHLMQLLINAPDSILTIHEQFDTPTKETLPDMAW
jgi:hypothetical protein